MCVLRCWWFDVYGCGFCGWWADSPFVFFFFQAEDGIRDADVTGVQTCALPILPKAAIEQRVLSAAKRLGISEFLDHRPRQLSGGQRQRVALGRAIVREPAVFLMDEPLSNLDAQLRVEMRAELRRLHLELARTFIYVTHDQAEALTMSD